MIWFICDGQNYPFLTALTTNDPCTRIEPPNASAVVPAVLTATGIQTIDLPYEGLAALLLALLGTAALW